MKMVLRKNLNSFELPLHRLELANQSFPLLNLSPDHWFVDKLWSIVDKIYVQGTWVHSDVCTTLCSVLLCVVSLSSVSLWCLSLVTSIALKLFKRLVLDWLFWRQLHQCNGLSEKHNKWLAGYIAAHHNVVSSCQSNNCEIAQQLFMERPKSCFLLFQML